MIVKNLKFLRKRYQVKQQELAEKLGINQSTLSDYETGRRPIPEDLIQNIAYIFRVTEFELKNEDLSQTEDMAIPDKDTVAKVFKAMFPHVEKSEVDEDDFFVKGYKMTQSIQEKIQEGSAVGAEEIKECLVSYRVSWETHNNHASIANYIAIILLLCATYREEDIQLFNAIYGDKELSYLDVKNAVVRAKPDGKKLKNISQQRREFVAVHEDLVLSFIKQLKATQVYAELADYYMVCMYYVGFVENDFDEESNQRIFADLLLRLYQIENHYAVMYVSACEPISTTAIF